MARFEIMNGVERRRRWSEADKRRIVAETLVPDAVIADVARRNGVATSLVFAWRRQARGNALQAPVEARKARPAFIPVTIARDGVEPASDTSASPSSIAISFGAHISMKIEGTPDAGMLAGVIAALSAGVARR